VVNETFSTYSKHAGTLLGGALIIFVVVGLASALLEDAGGLILILLATAIRMAGYALFEGFVVNLVSDSRDGKLDQSIGDLFSAAMPFILPLIGFGILFGIGVSIGFLLLIVPGLILLTFWSVGAPAIVVERVGVIEAFGRSWRLVRGDAWSVFGALLVIFLIVFAITILLTLIGAAIGLGGLIVFSIIASVITAPIYALAAAIIYFDLAGARPATAPGSAEPPTAQAPPAPPASQQPQAPPTDPAPPSDPPAPTS
jgi:hypothetical protein